MNKRVNEKRMSTKRGDRQRLELKLPLQSPAQRWSSALKPLHCAPPNAGAGSVQVLVRLVMYLQPPGQGLQALHSDNPPSTGEGTGITTNKKKLRNIVAHQVSNSIETFCDDSFQKKKFYLNISDIILGKIILRAYLVNVEREVS